MDDAGPLEVMQALVSQAEQSAALSSELLELVKGYAERVAFLEEQTATCILDMGRLTRRSRLLVNMKACTLTMTCRKCGAEYAKEPGPELCGPCWCELGKPERYLTPTA